MSNFFSRTSVAMRFLAGLGTLIIVNFLFLLTSLPIFTIGASISALYRITFEIHMGNDPFVVKDYFRYFKENFKQSTLVFVPAMIIAAIWCGNIYIVYNKLESSYRWLQYPIIALLVIMASILVYIFPMISLFENKLSKMIKDSLLLSIGNIPVTIFVIASYVFKYLLIDLVPVLGVVIFSLYVFVGFAFDSWLFGFFINRAFKIEKPKPERDAQNQ